MTYVPAVIVLMLIYMTSLVGLTNDTQFSWYLGYSNLFIILHTLFLLLYHKTWNKPMLIFSAIAMFLPLIIDCAVLCTDLLGTQFAYREHFSTLNCCGVPLIMGLYWFNWNYSSAYLSSKLPINNNLLLSLTGALMILIGITLVHLVIPHLGFWEETSWVYLALWTVIGFMVQYSYHALEVKAENSMALYVYGGMLIFFSGLVMFL